ncbi:hypothetical protein Tco_0998652 [Tanacetum coccineum]
MAETMQKYMSKTRVDYGLGIARPKIDDNDSVELKGQFLKELLLGFKDFQDILRVTAAQFQLLSDYYCWKDSADIDEIKD